MNIFEVMRVARIEFQAFYYETSFVAQVYMPYVMKYYAAKL